jgi:4-alpha-glucanotransferase
VYDWEALAASGFDWWLRRVRIALQRFDLVRWDHFRGLAATWEIPVGLDGAPAPAVQGHWRAVPGRALLQRLRDVLGPLPLIAENLGVITLDVERLRRDFALPGLHVLQFAFDGAPDNPHLPVHHEEQGVACTGTHDNDTALGWWDNLDERTRAAVRAALGSSATPMPDALIAAALESRCRLAMLPLQDLLRLGSEARMNRPGVAAAQWRWRYEPARLTAAGAAHWRERVDAASRA